MMHSILSDSDVQHSNYCARNHDLPPEEAGPREFAKAYARLRWLVFPVHSIRRNGTCTCDNEKCRSPGKHPIPQSWKKARTRRIESVRRLFKHGLRNIAISTGADSGLFVLDIDSRHGGLESLERLQQDHEKLPSTFTVRTGGKGLHLYFKWPQNGPPITNSNKGLHSRYEGIDVRGEGGYVVAPPSKHKSGRPYTVVNRRVVLADAPDWLLSILRCESQSKTGGRSALRKAIPEGSRNETLFRYACQLYRKRLSATQVYQKLSKLNGLRCEPPLEKDELRSIVKSAFKYRGQRRKASVITKNSLPFDPIDAKVLITIDEILYPPDTDDPEDKDNTPMEIKRRQIASVVIAWLESNGRLINGSDGRLYYFYADSRTLYDLSTSRWGRWIYFLTGINPTTTNHKSLIETLWAFTAAQEEKTVGKVCQWVEEEGALYVSRFDGTVFRLDGDTIAEQKNGESVLLYHNPRWEPYSLEETGTDGVLRRFSQDTPFWDSYPVHQGLALRVFIVASFFPELCPSRPLLLLSGEKGSGKSTTMRMLLRYLFGRYAEVHSVPDKPDAFVAAASSLHLYAMDNLDGLVSWLQDKLARAATGSVDMIRRLYTSNDVMEVRYRCSLIFTSRSPDTFRRDDLADRTVMLKFRRIMSSTHNARTEHSMYRELETSRNAWWSDLLSLLNAVVLHRRQNPSEQSPTIRMGDWELLGRRVADIEGLTEEWEEFVDLLRDEQSILSNKYDQLIQIIDDACEGGVIKSGKEYSARELYETIAKSFVAEDMETSRALRSHFAFGKALSVAWNDIRAKMNVSKRKSSGRANQHRWLYAFTFDDAHEQ